MKRLEAPVLAAGATLAAVALLFALDAADRPAAAAAIALPAPVPAAGTKAETDSYVAEIKANSGYKPGAESTVDVVLVPKGAYHINAQYPYKFKTPVPAPDGLSYPKAVLVRADGTFSEKEGTFRLPFVAAKPGHYAVGGVLSLSVCSEANCLIDKVPLEVSVDVK